MRSSPIHPPSLEKPLTQTLSTTDMVKYRKREKIKKIKKRKYQV
jgi:hypothetical protein